MTADRIVIKIGGSAGIDLNAVCDDIAEFAHSGASVVVIHGGSERANQLARAQGHPPVFLTSPNGHVSRYTDRAMRDIFVRATDQLNAEIVALLEARQLTAVGLIEEDCALWGERKETIRAMEDGRVRIIRDDYSGHIRGVDTDRTEELLSQGSVPVLPPLARSAADGLLNIDGDRAAAAVAAAIGAEQLIIISNVSGLLQHYPIEESLVAHVSQPDLERAIEWAQGRMKRKVMSVKEALDNGVRRVGLADGRVAHPLRHALAGGGTWFD
jgi:[amino group carrier protein]-L-2-aminoadipate/L-glutamate 6-kinase